MAHGMTVGELAKFFNREIGVDLTVVPMEGYTRDMIYQDTGLEWVRLHPTSRTLILCSDIWLRGLGRRDRYPAGRQVQMDRRQGALTASCFAELPERSRPSRSQVHP